jgi:hypothetical protein
MNFGLVKFECGCIGFANQNEKGEVLVVKTCDKDTETRFAWFWREVRNPENYCFVLNTQAEVIREQLCDESIEAGNFRTIKRVLSWKEN